MMLAGKLVYLRQCKQGLGIIAKDFDEKVNSLKISEFCNDDIEGDEKKLFVQPRRTYDGELVWTK